MKIKFFTFIFCIWKRIYLARKHSLGRCNLYYYISSKVFFSVAGYLRRKNETPTSIWTRFGEVDVALWSEILSNKVGILISVLIAMNYFSRYQKSTFNLENNKCTWLYVLIMSRTHLRVNPHSIFALMSRNSLLEIGEISEV